jgi:hypothetical protein
MPVEQPAPNPAAAPGQPAQGPATAPQQNQQAPAVPLAQ